MNVVIANIWKRRRKRWGGAIDFINKNIIRRALTFLPLTTYDESR